MELLRGALRISDPGLSEAQAADVVAAQWPRLPLGERAGYVAKTLTNQNQTSQWGGAAWAELTPEETCHAIGGQTLGWLRLECLHPVSPTAGVLTDRAWRNLRFHESIVKMAATS